MRIERGMPCHLINAGTPRQRIPIIRIISKSWQSWFKGIPPLDSGFRRNDGVRAGMTG